MPCTDCPLHAMSPNSGIEGAGSVPNNVMIIVDMPTMSEIQTYKIGNVNRWLGRELLNVGIDINKCYFTYAVKCYAGKLTKSDVKKCKHKLLEEIDKVKPKYILTLGSNALYALTGKTSLKKLRGEILELDGMKVLSTYHPSSVIRTPEELTVFRSDLYYFKRLVDNDWHPLTDFKWRVVRSKQDREDFRNAVLSSSASSYDVETTSLKDTDNGKLLMAGVATSKEVFIFPWEHPIVKRKPENFPRDDFNFYFANAVYTVGQNAKFDNRWLRTRGVINPHAIFDTYLAAYTLNNTLPHGLKYLAKVELGAKSYDTGIEFTEDFSFMKMAEYCALDCYYTLKLYPILYRRLLNYE